MEVLWPDLIEQLFKVFVYFQGFSQPQYFIFNANILLVLEELVVIAMYMAKTIEVYWFEVAVKDFYNFLLRGAYKMEDEALDFLRNFTYDIIIFSYFSSGCWGWDR